jgi:catechol 2,3-dioxygenase-like lactoylglutathione lyase family enzyme
MVRDRPARRRATALGPKDQACGLRVCANPSHTLRSSCLLAMHVRIARHTDRLEELVAFYRDRVGLPETGRFVDHDGYDGVFLDVPGTGTELELTTGGNQAAPLPHPESLLVLYFDSQTELEGVANRIAQPEVIPANPYWQAHATAFADPDGFQLLLVASR